MGEIDEDLPTLSAETFAALQQFYDEEKSREDDRRAIMEAASDDTTPKTLTMDDFKEDWQLSQFWYDDETAGKLAEECKRLLVGNEGKIACISCPTLYMSLKKILPSSVTIHLFEHDKRFAAFGSDFVFYDYKSPLDIPREFKEEFDIVFADPPFLSEECLTKTCVTVKYMAKNKIILCTGAIMEDLISRLLSLKKCKFIPHHRNNLANEFRCFANCDINES